MLYYFPIFLWRNTVGKVLKKVVTVESVANENGTSEGVKEIRQASGASKHVKAEKVAGKRKVKKSN